MTRIDEIRKRMGDLSRTRAQKNTSRDAEMAWIGAIDEVHSFAPGDIAFLLAEVDRLQTRIDQLEPPKPHCKRPGCAWRNGRCSICEAP